MLKGNTLKEKWQYFKDYYLKITLVVGIAILFGIYILYTTVFGYKSPAATVLIISSEEPDCENLEQQLEEVLDVDYVAVEWMSQDQSNLSSVLSTRFAAADIDLFIAPEEIFSQYAQDDTMENLNGSSLKESDKAKEFLADADQLTMGIVKNSNDMEIKSAIYEYLIQ